jgi:hypothetical protein
METTMQTLAALDHLFSELVAQARNNRKWLLWLAFGAGVLWLLRVGFKRLVELYWTLFGLGMALFWSGGWLWSWR